MELPPLENMSLIELKSLLEEKRREHCGLEQELLCEIDGENTSLKTCKQDDIQKGIDNGTENVKIDSNRKIEVSTTTETESTIKQNQQLKNETKLKDEGSGKVLAKTNEAVFISSDNPDSSTQGNSVKKSDGNTQLETKQVLAEDEIQKAQPSNEVDCRRNAERAKPVESTSEEINKDDDEYEIWQPPSHCIPIRADVRDFDFSRLAEKQKELTGRLFDVIMTDPPWQLATSNPTRGVAIGYQQLADSLIQAIPFGALQDNGFLFIWVINVKYKFALDWAASMGYVLVDEVVWVKSTVNRRLAKSHGFYLQHAKETCLMFRKGSDPPNTQYNVDNDVIYSVRRGQSQKPVEIYEMIERLVPGGSYLEIFGRRNNLRDYWCTIGNEL